MYFINLYDSANAYDRRVLSSLGINVLATTKIKDKERCIVNINKVNDEILQIRDGIYKNKLCACCDLVYGEYIKPYVLLSGILKKTDNRYNPEKLHRNIIRCDYKKTVLIQRLDMIIAYLATTGRLNHLRTA